MVRQNDSDGRTIGVIDLEALDKTFCPNCHHVIVLLYLVAVDLTELPPEFRDFNSLLPRINMQVSFTRTHVWTIDKLPQLFVSAHSAKRKQSVVVRSDHAVGTIFS